MANRRMFALGVIDGDDFLSMPLSTQALYFHLSMRADDDGFVNNPRKIVRMAGCNEDEMRLLIAKDFVIPFESGVCVIKHWKIHNYLRADRYKETRYSDEKAALLVKKSGEYERAASGVPGGIPALQDGIPTVNQPAYQRSTQVSKGKARIDQVSQEPDEDEQASCIRYYQDNGITLSFRHYDEIGDFLIDGVSGELIRYAADVSIENAAKSWKYAKTIITKWRDNGVNTVDAARIEQAAFKAKKNAPTSQPMYSPMMTRVEDCLNDD